MKESSWSSPTEIASVRFDARKIVLRATIKDQDVKSRINSGEDGKKLIGFQVINGISCGICTKISAPMNHTTIEPIIMNNHS